MNISFATKILITKTETVNNILLSNFFNNPFEMANKNKTEQGIWKRTLYMPYSVKNGTYKSNKCKKG